MIFASTVLFAVSCTSAEPEVEQLVEQSSVSADLVSQSWPVRFAADSVRAPFEGHPGWSEYFQRNFASALSQLEGEGQARLHLEYAASYRQAALLHSHAVDYLYGASREDSEAEQTVYLRGVALALLGKTEESKSALAAFGSHEDETLRLHASQWIDWLSSDRKSNPPLEGFFFEGGPPTPGTMPAAGSVVHYSFPAAQEGESATEASEGTALWLRAVWHEEAARQLLGESQGVADLWLNPWRLPMEAKASVEEPALSDDWLFLGFSMIPEDALFLDAAHSEGSAAIGAWRERSVLAAALDLCLEDGKISPESALEQAALLEQTVLESMKASTGTQAPFYVNFADFAEQALLRAAVVVAEASDDGSNEQSYAAGKLRLNINDMATGPTLDPVFRLSMAAWDVGKDNPYPLRAQDTIHALSDNFPALPSARVPLDALHIRMGRNSTSSGPAH
jgi:hypothetical protein